MIAGNSLNMNASIRWTEKDSMFKRTDRSRECFGSDTTINLWRGERLGLAAMFTADCHTGRLAARIESTAPSPVSADTYFIDYVLTDSYSGCEHPDATLPAFEVGDALVKSTSSEISKGTSRYLWATIDAPHDMVPGSHRLRLIVSDKYKGTDLDTLNLTVNVLDRTLPKPHDQNFFLNFWQQPYAISRYYGVEPWSDRHLELLKPYARLLARAGQKVVTTILFYEPWGVQSNDRFLPMVETTLGKDGKWKYDYSAFDRYVGFMADNGIDQYIECFSMIPWNMSFRYMDEASGEYRFLTCGTGDQEYSDLWTPFLKSFERHLKKNGWLDKTMLAIDERGLADMQNALAIAKAAAPGLKFSLAGDYHPEIADDMTVLTLKLGDPCPDGVMKERERKGLTSLYYTCCSSPEPNIFTNSNPTDAAYLPVSCIANGGEGYLHWSFSNWTDDPLNDSRFFLYTPGDTYCVYPDGGSSVRLERLIEGIHIAEKIRILLTSLDEEKKSVLLKALEPFAGLEPPAFADRLRNYKELLNVISEVEN